ncbi:hypothetical protein BT96DRAFT_918916 [Gymnopus androsaceus JB14]|uniref:Secreted protein n=1 Tax=Gymnopus androsaceus JB14 TaxID=1447944 RepID=A0A6A4HT53_9AGAR|nr:hypothetical protein BT96DRAFT_918916 [Gymnopus androsaceus JB14]
MPHGICVTFFLSLFILLSFCVPVSFCFYNPTSYVPRLCFLHSSNPLLQEEKDEEEYLVPQRLRWEEVEVRLVVRVKISLAS